MAVLSLGDRLKHAWNAFTNEEERRGTSNNYSPSYGVMSSYRPDRVRLTPGNEKSIIAAVYNRIAIDTAAITIRHVRVDQNGVYKETIDSSLNNCLTLDANIDQTGRSFIMDTVLSMFDEGVVAIVPVDTNTSLINGNTFDILSMRTGRITGWMPRSVRIEIYNDNLGIKQEVTLPKDKVAIIENPLYAVMNDHNSTLKRLVRKLNLLDAIDEQSSASKLDLIVQLPYAIKGETRMAQAEKRRTQLEEQLRDSKYGIAYIDATEKVTQLGRPLENNLMSQIEYLTSMLYSQLGITQAIFDGNADEQTLLNYHNRTIEPILSAITLEMKRKFLTKTARTQGQSIEYFSDPFRLVPVNEIADIADKFTRNEVLSSNEVRAIVGYRPVDDERADELRNKNINATDAQLQNPVLTSSTQTNQNGSYTNSEQNESVDTDTQDGYESFLDYPISIFDENEEEKQ
jgi:ribosomal protein L21E